MGYLKISWEVPINSSIKKLLKEGKTIKLDSPFPDSKIQLKYCSSLVNNKINITGNNKKKMIVQLTRKTLNQLPATIRITLIYDNEKISRYSAEVLPKKVT